MLKISTHLLFIMWFCNVEGFLVICWPISTYSAKINQSITQSNSLFLFDLGIILFYVESNIYVL